MNNHAKEMSAEEIDEIVSRRREFLAALEEAPATKPELVDRLDTSRSTVDRAISELERYELVARPEDEYTLTLAGRQAYERHEAYLDRLDDIAAANEILASLPPGAPFTLDLLDGAEVEQATRHNPLQPLDLAADVLSTATRLRQVSPAVFPVCVEVIGERAQAGDLELDLIVPPDVVDVLDEEYGEESSWVGVDGNQLYVVEETPPYALWVAETPEGTHTGLLSNSETGVRGIVVNEDPDCAEWALDRYETYLDDARPVDSLAD